MNQALKRIIEVTSPRYLAGRLEERADEADARGDVAKAQELRKAASALVESRCEQCGATVPAQVKLCDRCALLCPLCGAAPGDAYDPGCEACRGDQSETAEERYGS